MIESLDILRMAGALASHAGARQAIAAENVANADTPGYRAMDLAPFSEIYHHDAEGGAMRHTRAAHLTVSEGAALLEPRLEPGPADPNGNSVSLETEMVRAADIRQQHDLALAVYSGAMDILRAGIGRSR